MDPLVEEYLRKKQGLDQEVSDARTKAEWMDAGSQVGQGLADLVQPRNQVIYEKGWNETGAPKIENMSNKAADFSGLKTMGQRGLQAAQENRNQGLQDFDQTQKLADLSQTRNRTATKFDEDMAESKQMRDKRAQDMAQDKEMNTPGSPQAREFAKFMQQAIPGSPDLSGLSLARQKELTGNLFDQWKLQNKPVETKPMDSRVVERLGKDTEEKAGVLGSFDRIEAALGNKLQVGVTGQPDIAGGSWPLVGRNNPTVWFNSQARDIDTAIASVVNEIARTNFGASQSTNELRRLQTQLANGKFNTEADRLNAIAELKNEYIRLLKEAQAKYPEVAREIYKQQGGTLATDVAPALPTNPAGATRTFKPIDQMTREEKLKELQELGGG